MKYLTLKVIFIFALITILKVILITVGEEKSVEKLKATIVDETRTNCLVTPLTCASHIDCEPCYPPLLNWECTENVCEFKKDIENMNIQECATENGGLFTYENMNYYGIFFFHCTCMFPDIFMGKGCTEKNPSICINGELSGGIENLKCECKNKKDYVSIMYNGLVYCVPKKYKWFMEKQKKGKIYHGFLGTLFI